MNQDFPFTDSGVFESAELSSFLRLAERAARVGGQVLIDRLGKEIPREKAPGNIVTDADFQSQRAIEQEIRHQFPRHSVLGEESADIGDWKSGFCWIIDPLDGTVNFVHRLHSFSVSVALLFKGSPVAGVVYDPLLNEAFSAIRGNGAKLNGNPIVASNCCALRQALLVSSFPPIVGANDPELQRFNRVVQQATMRRLGSAALNLCYVANGRLDGYWGSTLSIWDVAAGFLISLEAGARLTHLSGGPISLADPQFLVTGTRELHDQLLPFLQLD